MTTTRAGIIPARVHWLSISRRESLASAALPVLRTERRRRQPFLVAQVRVGDVPPPETHLSRLLDILGGHDHLIAVDGRLGRDELAVFAGDLELAERLAVARLQPAADVGERQLHLAAVDLHRL